MCAGCYAKSVCRRWAHGALRCQFLPDTVELGQPGEEKERAETLLALLTPIVKAFLRKLVLLMKAYKFLVVTALLRVGMAAVSA